MGRSSVDGTNETTDEVSDKKVESPHSTDIQSLSLLSLDFDSCLNSCLLNFREVVRCLNASEDGYQTVCDAVAEL